MGSGRLWRTRIKISSERDVRRSTCCTDVTRAFLTVDSSSSFERRLFAIVQLMLDFSSWKKC